MDGKPLHSNTRENGFKKPDRVDRRPHDDKTPKTEHKPSDFAPNPNDESHKPKIVPWK
ncbi:MAG: hypothetical protein NC299_11140 [Lachnospiraceae bacterium]|nr:hypothetical protein [Ruminococcus sp.]MCM1275901.1 hypothetical protein [Lachnospiraceae bacterium]